MRSRENDCLTPKQKAVKGLSDYLAFLILLMVESNCKSKHSHSWKKVQKDPRDRHRSLPRARSQSGSIQRIGESLSNFLTSSFQKQREGLGAHLQYPQS